MPTLLDASLLTDTLESLPGWQGSPDKIWRDVHLTPEQDAELRRQVSVDGGSMQHEPVVEEHDGATRFVLRTDSAGGVTELDISLASHISDLVHRLSADEPGVDAHRHDPTVAVFRGGDDGDPEPRLIGTGSGNGGTPQVPLPSTHPHAPEPGISTEQTRP
jgi:4a-hydroxytetrahydrobiopterin dehydratase